MMVQEKNRMVHHGVVCVQKPNCSYYTRRGSLCKPHLSTLKKQKISINKDNSKKADQTSSIDSVLSEEKEPKKGDIIILSNGIRKKYDGKQYRRVYIDQTCTIVIHNNLEYQNRFVKKKNK